MQRVNNGISCKRIVCIKLLELCCIKYHSDTLYYFFIKNKYQNSVINVSCCDNSVFLGLACSINHFPPFTALSVCSLYACTCTLWKPFCKQYRPLRSSLTSVHSVCFHDQNKFEGCFRIHVCRKYTFSEQKFIDSRMIKTHNLFKKDINVRK